MQIHANGITHHVNLNGPEGHDDTGRPAFVFLHYFGGSGESWAGVIDGLGPQPRSIAPDLRGFGETEAPASGYTIDDYADDIAGLIGALGLADYVLVGHSMGGKIALALAARRPCGLSALVLVAPSPPTPEPMKEAERTRQLETHGQRAAALQTIEKIVHHKLPPALLERAVQDNLRSSAAAWRAWLEEGSREDISGRMDAVEAPVTVLVGRNDGIMPRELLQREVADRVGGTLVVASNAGHLLPLETPQALIRILRGFLADPAPPPRYPAGTTEALLHTDFVTQPTREALAERLMPEETAASRVLDSADYATLGAACARIIEHPVAPRIAAAIRQRLAEGRTDGWRYDEMPADTEAYRLGLRGLDESARIMFGEAFTALNDDQKDGVLAALQNGKAAGETWKTLSAARFFEEFLVECAELFYSEAAGQDLIGYAGYADAHGWQAVGLNERASHEPRPLGDGGDG